MKQLSEYLLYKNTDIMFIECANGEIELLTEGFWDKLGGLLGKSVNGIKGAMKGFSQGFNGALTTANVVAAQTKDSDTKKMIANLNTSLADAGSEKEAIVKLKANAESVIKGIENGEITRPSYALSVKNVLLAIEGDADCKKLAEKLNAVIEEKFGKKANVEAKKIEKVATQVEKADVVPSGGEDDKGKKEKKNGPRKSKRKASIGLSSDGELLSTTKQQEQNEVQAKIMEDKDFYASLAKASGLSAETLRDSIVGLINNSLKEESKDKEGNVVYKWKKDTKGFNSKNEDNLIKGLAAIFSGLAMINHKGMNEKIVGLLIDTGFSKQDYINNLIKK